MGRKAGIWITAAAVAVTAAVTTAAVFGAGASTSAPVKRAGALHLQARIEGPAAARAARATATAGSKHRPSILYGFTKPQFIPAGEHSVSVAGCPRRYHPTNGTVAAQNGSDAQYLTIRGSGPLANSKGKIKGWFIDLNVATSPTPVPALASIVCQH